MNIRPRNDIVLIRINFLDKDPETGMALPQKSAEAAEYIVEAMGDDVQGLKVGDKVEVIGDRESFAFVPRYKHLFVTREKGIALVYEQEVQ